MISYYRKFLYQETQSYQANLLGIVCWHCKIFSSLTIGCSYSLINLFHKHLLLLLYPGSRGVRHGHCHEGVHGLEEKANKTLTTKLSILISYNFLSHSLFCWSQFQAFAPCTDHVSCQCLSFLPEVCCYLCYILVISKALGDRGGVQRKW